MKNKFNSYAQYGEDSILLEFFGLEYKGLIVDIGALDGYHLSNSFLLSELGWKSILVEAHPELSKVCINNRKKDIVIPKAVANINGTIKMKISNRGSHSHISNIGIDIECETLDFMLSRTVPENTVIDVLSIDVDGSEEYMFKEFTIEKWSPSIIILETSMIPNSINSFVENSGYHKAIETGINVFLMKNLDDVDKLRSILNSCRREYDKLLTESFNHFDTQHILDIGEDKYYELVNREKMIINNILKN